MILDSHASNVDRLGEGLRCAYPLMSAVSSDVEGPAAESESEAHQPSAVAVGGLHKVYDGHLHALRGIDLVIAEGEFVTLLGPSGSGKTTLLMVIAGFEAPTRGDVFARGNDITRVAPERRNFGVVFQSYALFPHMTAAGNVGYPLAARGIGGKQRREQVDEALELVGARRPRRSTPVAACQGASSSASPSHVPSSTSPPCCCSTSRSVRSTGSFSERMQIELRNLHQRVGITFLYVTHDQDEALTMSDRVAVMRDGLIEQVGTPEEIYGRPATEFVASFVGIANVIRGEAVGSSDGFLQVELDGGARIRVKDRRGDVRSSKVTVVVRPERAEVNRIDDSSRPPAGLTGEVVKEIFGGNMWRYRISTPAGEVQAHTTRRAPARLGDPGPCLVGSAGGMDPAKRAGDGSRL